MLYTRVTTLFLFAITFILNSACQETSFIHSLSYQYASIGSSTTDRFCRTVAPDRRIPIMCSESLYYNFTCIGCYVLLPEDKFVSGMFQKYKMYTNGCNYGMYLPVNKTLAEWYHPNEYDYKNESSAIRSTVTEEGKKFWMQCCEAASECCKRQLSVPPKAKTNGTQYCPKTFDGWQCFDETEAGKIHESYCEDHIQFGNPPKCRSIFTRKCGEDGSWPTYKNYTGTEHTDYSECLVATFQHQTHVGAFIVSICALLPAIIIFLSYQKLKVPRMALHRNLFLSFFLNAVAFIIFKTSVVIPGQSWAKELSISEGACRFIYALTRYTRMTNYAWMFCEGFYLHKLFAAAFSEQKSIIMYYIIGWGLPLIPTLIYSVLRITDSEANIKCWGLHPVLEYEWILMGTMAACLAVNFVFLFNIVRILVTKLRSSHATNRQTQYRKAARATLMMVPLFGLHFFLTLYRPGKTTPCFWLDFFQYVAYILDGIQGFFVALIFCYLNGEVSFLLRRSFREWRDRRMPPDYSRRRSTTTTVSGVMSASEQSPAKKHRDQMELTDQKKNIHTVD